MVLIFEIVALIYAYGQAANLPLSQSILHPRCSDLQHPGIGVIAPVAYANTNVTYYPGDIIPLQISTVLNDVFDTDGSGQMTPIVIDVLVWTLDRLRIGYFRPTELTVGRSWQIPTGIFPKETMIYSGCPFDTAPQTTTDPLVI